MSGVRFSGQGWGERVRRLIWLSQVGLGKQQRHIHRQKLQATEILRATGFNLGAGISVSGSRGRIG